jgi:hypothetical protein
VTRSRVLAAELSQCDVPNWLPLEDLVGIDLSDWFMWMGELTLGDGTAIHLYKHIATRRYFHLSEDGRAFIYTRDGRYREIARTGAIDEAFDGWEDLLPQPEDPAAVELQLKRAREAATAPD